MVSRLGDACGLDHALHATLASAVRRQDSKPRCRPAQSRADRGFEDLQQHPARDAEDY